MTVAMENRLRRIERSMLPKVVHTEEGEILGYPPFSRWCFADQLYALDLMHRDAPEASGAEARFLHELDQKEASYQQFRARPDISAAIAAGDANGGAPQISMLDGLRWPDLIARTLWHDKQYSHGVPASMFFAADGTLRPE